MSKVKLNMSSFNSFKSNFDKEQKAASEEFKKKFLSGDIKLPLLPKDIEELSDEAMKEYDKKIRQIIKKEVSNIRYKNHDKKRVIEDKDIHSHIRTIRPTNSDRGTLTYTDENGNDARYHFSIDRDSHGYTIYNISNLTRKRRAIEYWFGDVPGYNEGQDYQPVWKKFPLLINKRYGDMYKSSKYPERYPDYVYMPYIVNTQPYAKDYIYYTDFSEPVGTYKRNTVRKGSKEPYHKKGEPRYPRRIVGRETWHNKGDKNYVSRIVDKINKSVVPYKGETKMYTVQMPKNTGITDSKYLVAQRSDVKENVKYYVKLHAEAGAGFKKG
ncbi:MAG: hypothetical protein ACI4WS_14940 [Oscillospiraceae bacterium]